MRDRSPAQSLAALLGAVFLLVGVAGFIPGITTHYGDMAFAGHNSDAKLLGIFQISILENIVHLLFGVAGVALAKTWEASRRYFIGGGIIYLVLFVYGLITGNESGANFVPTNAAGDVLHVVLGVAMIGIGVVLGKTVTDRDRAAPAV